MERFRNHNTKYETYIRHMYSYICGDLDNIEIIGGYYLIEKERINNYFVKQKKNETKIGSETYDVFSAFFLYEKVMIPIIDNKFAKEHEEKFIKCIVDLFIDNMYIYLDSDYLDIPQINACLLKVFLYAIIPSRSDIQINDYIMKTMKDGEYISRSFSRRIELDKKSYTEEKAIKKIINNEILNKHEQSVTMPITKMEKASNILYIGPPGTGKSYEIKEKLNNVEEEHYERITFHQDYDNSDFVGSILPWYDEEKNTIIYRFIAGPITRTIKKAIQNTSTMYYLVIEEMSRGNCGAIFGDTFQLLDRDEYGNSEYGITNHLMEKEIYDTIGINKIIIPSNLTIFGTVNSSDQNIFAMDTAFMRRFEIKYISTDLKDSRNEKLQMNILGMQWIDLYKKINEFIIHKDFCALSEDKQIGPFFIINSEEYLTKLFRYLHHDIDRISNGYTIIDDNINGFNEVMKNVNNGKDVYSKEFKEFMSRDVN